MKERLLIVKNVAHEGPGLLGDVLRERGIAYDVVEFDHGQDLPRVENYAALVVLGGPKSANDDDRCMHDELACIRGAIASGLPYLGICLGLHALVKAGGGKVVSSPTKEVGFRDPDGKFFTIELTREGREDPLFKGLANSFKVFQLHGETVELAGGMTLLATGSFCRHQIIRVGSHAYGIQCHFELTQEMFEKLVCEDPDLSELEIEGLRADFAAIEDEYTCVGRQLLQNFLAITAL